MRSNCKQPVKEIRPADMRRILITAGQGKAGPNSGGLPERVGDGEYRLIDTR